MDSDDSRVSIVFLNVSLISHLQFLVFSKKESLVEDFEWKVRSAQKLNTGKCYASARLKTKN